MTVALKGTDFAKSFEMTVRSADKTALNEVIAEAGSDEFEAAFDAAKKVAADEDATPAQVADALAALQAARKALVKVDGEKPDPQELSTKPGPQEPAVKPSPNGKVDATVTNPLNKEAMNLAGHHFSGHTEIYAHYTGTEHYTMMLAHKDLRVVHVSTHVSLREACDRVKKDRVLEVIRIADKACRDMGIAKPRIGVAGLNPHCGEGGLFGREEIDEIAPAIEAARIAGIDAQGPIPPDTIFSKAIGGWYDIVVAMYHDQGHIPLKVVGFVYDREKQSWSAVEGVNITLGLPIIRTSVDHGTAFDQAGTGKANELSLKNAIEYAVRFAANR